MINDEEWNALKNKAIIPLKDFASKIEKYLRSANSLKIDDDEQAKDKIIKKFEQLRPEKHSHQSELEYILENLPKEAHRLASFDEIQHIIHNSKKWAEETEILIKSITEEMNSNDTDDINLNEYSASIITQYTKMLKIGQQNDLLA